MVNLTIDGRQISVEENTTIMEAARSVGIRFRVFVISKASMK